MSRKLSLLSLCCLLLISGSPAMIAESAVPSDSKTEVASSARCGRCGDGSCVKSCGETAESCPVDCGGGPGVPSVASTQAATPACGGCGDGYCVTMCGETAESCPSDCGKIKPNVELNAVECAAKGQPAKTAEAKKE